MNTHIESRGDRKVVVLNKDFAAGELIYKEKPVVAVLDADLQESGKYCAHCLRSIDSGMSTVLPEVNPILSTFCSKACLIANESQSHNLLFTLEPPLPAEFMQSLPPNVKQQSDADRKDAQEAFVAHIKKEPRAASLLVARFIARQVAVETAKLTRSAHEKSDFTDAEKIGSYMLADHLERLRFIDVKPNTDELKALVDILRISLPGLEHFVTDDRHALLLGKMVYNAFGVCFGAGRDDKPQPTARTEDVEKTRTPYGTSRQIGSAFYTLSSYLPHSCAPNARPSFSEGTSELHLIANRDLKAGDELSVAYVDVTQKDGESAIECRRRRRFELARGWRFPCPCDRCLQESKELSTEEKVADAKEEKDGSKVEIHPSLADAEVE
ncbi:hypothetical protein C0991_006239 [Blastosporella zonata]|nr:hypothetical protein C0991_006239 [Blastosporella zonata]